MECIHDQGCPTPRLCKDCGECVGQYGYQRVITDNGVMIVPVILTDKDLEKQKRAKSALTSLINKGMIKPQPISDEQDKI